MLFFSVHRKIVYISHSESIAALIQFVALPSRYNSPLQPVRPPTQVFSIPITTAAPPENPKKNAGGKLTVFLLPRMWLRMLCVGGSGGGCGCRADVRIRGGRGFGIPGPRRILRDPELAALHPGMWEDSIWRPSSYLLSADWLVVGRAAM